MSSHGSCSVYRRVAPGRRQQQRGPAPGAFQVRNWCTEHRRCRRCPARQMPGSRTHPSPAGTCSSPGPMSNQAPWRESVSRQLARTYPGKGPQVVHRPLDRAPARGPVARSAALACSSARSSPARSRRLETQAPTKSLGVSGSGCSSAASTPPHRPWPMTTISPTSSARIAYSRAALTPRDGELGRVRGDERGDVADHEQLSGSGVEHDLRRRPRIRARNDHGRGTLTVRRQPTIALALRRVSGGTEPPVARLEILRKDGFVDGHDQRWYRLALARPLHSRLVIISQEHLRNFQLRSSRRNVQRSSLNPGMIPVHRGGRPAWPITPPAR